MDTVVVMVLLLAIAFHGTQGTTFYSIFPFFSRMKKTQKKKSIRNSAQTREKYTKHKITEESTTKNYEDKIPPEKNIY